MSTEWPNDNPDQNTPEYVRLNALIVHETGSKLRLLKTLKDTSMAELVRRSIATYHYFVEIKAQGGTVFFVDEEMSQEVPFDFDDAIHALQGGDDIPLSCNLNMPTRAALDTLKKSEDIHTNGETIDRAVDIYFAVVEKQLINYSIRTDVQGKVSELIVL